VDNPNLEYNLPNTAYVNFDALSLKSFMIEQLNNGGKFTDQNYEGSNISSILDILAYYTHVLMFYLNQTSSESVFSQTSIYENMNRIVKLIGYKPTGRQTSLSPINCEASATLIPGNYVIKKYSYFLIDNIQYTFISDYSFSKILTGNENILSISDNATLYQGVVGEYPIYTASGVEYETLPIVVTNLTSDKDTRFISHGTLSVYVKEIDTGLWAEYEEVDSLFLSSSTSRVYDIRLNENGNYEIKFGNGVFGKSLKSGDEVIVYYILSDGERGQISKNSINGNKLFTYNNSKFNEIYNDIGTDLIPYLLTDSNKSSLTFNNQSNSTLIQDAESVEQIRENTPAFLATQIRLVTELDYEKFLRKSIPNVLNDVKVVDNNKYISEYIQYFYDICVDPNKVNRVILNQVNFADSCDFNNINIFCVPSINLQNDGMYPDFLNNNFKNLIKTITNDKKIIGNEVVPRDPIYMGLDFGYGISQPTKNMYNFTKLVIVRSRNNKSSKDMIKTKVFNTISNYFNSSNTTLGMEINISQLTADILSISGVESIQTVNTNENVFINGISFVVWNPLFEGADITLINQNTTLPFFKFPYIYNPKTIINRIEVIDK
jgi:hypothetical protein